MSVLSDLVQSILDAPDKFADVIAQGPIEALLVGMGGLIILVTVGVLAILVLGAIADLVRSGSTGVSHPGE